MEKEIRKKSFSLGLLFLERYAWIPIPLLLAAIIVGRVSGLTVTYRHETLRLVLSATFYTLASLGTLVLIGRSFLESGRPGLLLLECGVLLWSLAGTVGDAVSHGDANVTVTIFNIGILFSGFCHLGGSILALWSRRTLRPAPLWLGLGCLLVLAGLWLLAQATLAKWLPVFFIPEQGGTPIRHWVLISAITMFVLSATLIYSRQRHELNSFLIWYILALLLLAVGLFGIMVQLSLWSIVNWLSRSAQWLGGFYLFIASIAAFRGSDLVLFKSGKNWRPHAYRYGISIALVLACASLRLVFLPMMGSRMSFVTFFPAVTLASLYGGLGAGLLATVLSALVASYFLIPSTGLFQFTYPVDWLALIIFLLSGWLIAWISEAKHRAHIRASAAEAQALLAAERAAAAEEIRKSEEKYRNLFENMAEEVHFWQLVRDEKGDIKTWRLVDANPPTLKTWERNSVEEIRGKTTDEIFGPGSKDHYLPIVRKIMTEGVAYSFEDYFPNLGKYFRFTSVPLGDYFITTGGDITGIKKAEEALQESEKRLRIALGATNTAMWDWEVHTGKVFWSPEHFLMLGYEPDSVEPSYANFAARVHSDDLPVTEAMIQETMSQHREYRHDFRVIMPDGGVRWIEARANYFYKDDEVCARMLGVMNDITERKQMEEALRTSKMELEERVQERTAELSATVARLEQLNQELQEFTFIASHDLQEPLRKIETFGDLVQKRSASLLDPTSQDHLERVLRSAHRMRQLLRDLLIFSRVTTEAEPFREIANHEMAHEAAEVLELRIKETGAELKIEPLPTIEADESQIRQLFQNLIANALKYRGSAPPLIRISGTRADQRTCEIRVEDNGIGFDMQYAKSIFKPFERLHGRSEYEGTGMGLAICRKIVERHGGTIRAESQTGLGSTFIIRLPLKQVKKGV